MNQYPEKKEKLERVMEQYLQQDAAIAFSGGVDSSLLLKLGMKYAHVHHTKIYAVTVQTELYPSEDVEVAKRVAIEAGAEHIVLRFNELEHEEIRHNPVDRCYCCKKILFTMIQEAAAQRKITTVMDGTNADDINQYRPGLRAIRELGIQSPILEAGLTKAEVRRLAEEYGISVSDRPSAPCLATRFPYGDLLSQEKLSLVDQGEQYLRELGIYNVRIRVHGELARIEVDIDSLPIILKHRQQIISQLKQLGYTYITLDMEGFRSGSMDVGLQ